MSCIAMYIFFLFSKVIQRLLFYSNIYLKDISGLFVTLDFLVISRTILIKNGFVL